MKVYKFGGASVQSGDGIKNLAKIVAGESGNLVLVISAMGKTTNALEQVVNTYLNLQTTQALDLLNQSKEYHLNIINNLFEESDCNGIKAELNQHYNNIAGFIKQNRRFEYDYCYDQIVSLGEMVSTRIVSFYLNYIGIFNTWLDTRLLLKTDSTFREANIRFDESGVKLRETLDFSITPIFLTQGFIGGNSSGETTTLGREGSDYTAAVIASLIDAESVTIWKDVPGILNADPRIFDGTKLLPAVSYKEAVELSYYGAQIIHPKTIKPLQNKNIPLYVKSFIDLETDGTVIEGNRVIEKEMPVYIFKKKQVLISISSKDFSFALEETLVNVFNMLLKRRIKVNLIQSSAVSISVCVDDTRNVQPAIEEFMNDYNIRYNKDLRLLTIRNYTDDMISKCTRNKRVYLVQKTRRTVRILMADKQIND
jgi:aspartate kinase